ncbi:MAG TPA: hypothetical protein VGR74_17320, partial [Actinomycetota bacterium]|nr:hypothetical protein [Actinomycetota bacterium]
MITTHQFVSDFVDDLAAQGVTFTDDTALKTALEDRFNQWLDSPDAVPANLAQRLAYSIGLFQSDILGRYDFWTLTATGGPHGDGTFDVAMPDGTTVPFPSLAKLEDEVSTLGGLTPLVDAAAASATLAENYAQKDNGYAASTDNSAKSWAIGGTSTGYPAAGPAKDWATKTGAAVVTGAYSAKEWSVGTFTIGAAAGGSAKAWATYTGGVVDDADFSSKAYAVGSPTAGCAKDWAQKTGGAVITGAYSAKEWSVGTFLRGAASGGSAKDWATYQGGVVDNAEFSAKAYAVGAPTAGSAKDWATKTSGEVVSGQGYGALKYANDAAASASAAFATESAVGLAAANVAALVPNDVFVKGHTPVTGSNASSGTYIFGQPFPAQTLSIFKVWGKSAGDIKLKRFTRVAQTFTFVEEWTFTLASGVDNVFLSSNSTLPLIVLNEGDYLGVYSASGSRLAFNTVSAGVITGVEYIYDASDLTTTKTITYSVVPSTGARIEVYFEGIAPQRDTAACFATDLTAWGATYTLGVDNPASSGATIL